MMKKMNAAIMRMPIGAAAAVDRTLTMAASRFQPQLGQ
jgi:hypothetical protein